MISRITNPDRDLRRGSSPQGRPSNISGNDPSEMHENPAAISQPEHGLQSGSEPDYDAQGR